MNGIRLFFLLMLAAGLAGCTDPTPVDDGPKPEITTGILEVEIKLPYIPLPKERIHLVDLSLARTADSLYRGLFLASPNVYDDKTVYRFTLAPGTYYYQAGITCSCLGDSCLWGGFPGGRFGVRWAIDKVDVIKGKVIRESPSFQ